MTVDELKSQWKNGAATLNGWLSIGNPFTAEIMAGAGYDSLTIDWQHGALDYGDLLPMLQASTYKPTVPFVRVPWLDAGAVVKALDAGAMGVICPMINTGADTAAFASYMRYPPRGQRSFGPTRASIADPSYSVDVNQDVLAFAMIETAQGVENLEEIAATEGIDGIYVGPADLTLGTQQGALPPGLDRQEDVMIDIIKRIADTCHKNGIVAGIHCGTTDYALRAIEWGFQMTTVGGDVKFIAATAQASVKNWRTQTGHSPEKTAPTKSMY